MANKSKSPKYVPPTRVTINLGPESVKVAQSLAAKFRKETGTEWTLLEILESATAEGLVVKAANVLGRGLKLHSLRN